MSIVLSVMFLSLIVSCNQGATTVTPSSSTPQATLANLPALRLTATTIPIITPVSAPQVPQSAILFQQDFESGAPNNLYNDGMTNWKTVTDNNGNHIYCNNDSNDYSYLVFGNNTWTNYAVEIKIKAQESKDRNAVLIARFNGSIGYYGTLNFKTHISGLKLGDPYQAIGWKSFRGDTNSWQTWRLEVAGNSIKYFINDQPIGGLTDSQLSFGAAGVYVFPNFKMCFDNIRVWFLTPEGQIAQAQKQSDSLPRSLSDRLASHKFPRLLYQDPDNFPSIDVLTQSAYRDIITFPGDLSKSYWSYIGPLGSIRLKNPNAVILTSMSVQEFFPWDNNPAGKDFVSKLKPDWVMKDIHGNPFPSFCCYNGGNWSTMMNLSTDVSTFIPDYLSETTMKSGLFDGIAYDGTNETWWQAQPASNRPSGPIDINNDGKADTTAQLNTAMDAGLQKLLNETHRVFPNGYLVVGNGGWDGALLLDKNAKTDTILANLLNGREVEGFLNWEKYGIDWLKSMRAYYLMQQVSLDPKTPFVTPYCTGQDYDHLRYVLASALMFDGYFDCSNYSPIDQFTSYYSATWWYDEYSVDLSTGKAVQSIDAKGYLGMPITEAYNVNDKNILLATLLTNNDKHAAQLVWRRDFQNGIVLVNPSGISMAIDLRGAYKKILGTLDPKFNDGSVVTKITLAAKGGVILLNP